MDQLKTAFIVNPGSGGRRKDRIRRAALARIREMFPGSPVETSRSAEEAATLSRSFLEKGYECIAVAGGDGSLSSALQGFFIDDDGTPVRKNAALAVIPIGTGGDFRKTLGIENDPLAALSLLGGDSTRPCDVGIVEYRDFEGALRKKYFLNIVSFGLSGLVDKYVMESTKKLGGTATFYLSTVRAFLNYRNADVEVTIDDRDTRKLRSVLVAVANGRYFGSGMHIAPMANIGDGLLEVVILGDLGLGDFLKHGSKLYKGQAAEIRDAYHKPAREVTITPAGENDVMYMDMDGEPFGTIPARVKVIPSAIDVKV